MRPRRNILAHTIAGLLALAATLAAREVPRHCLVFEEWIDDPLIASYRPPGYTQKWDIPAPKTQATAACP